MTIRVQVTGSLLSLAVAVTGCATGRTVSTIGKSVTVLPAAPAKAKRVQGELIAVESERMWVLGREHVVEIPLEAIGEVQVERHSFDTKSGLLWTGIGALVTGGAMALACNSVKSSGCGKVFGVITASWVLLGGVPSIGLDDSARIHLRQPTADALRPYARFPQGPPPGVDLGAVVAPTTERAAH